MTATNHALTGVFVVSVISSSFFALPLAFASHFILDFLPHFGEVFEDRKRFSMIVWVVDLILLFSLLTVLAFGSQWLIMAGAILAISPDFAWFYRFVFHENFGKLAPRPLNKFNKFHVSIQKFESRSGLIFEAFWFALIVYLLAGIK